MSSGFRWIDVLSASCCLSLACLIGCTTDSDHGRVSGTVLLDNSPLVDAQVEFIPTAAGSTAYGRTDENGYYQMEYARDSVGASIGENEVRITSSGASADENGDLSFKKEQVPARYNLKTELVFKVESGSNTADFSLTSEGEILNTMSDAANE